MLKPTKASKKAQQTSPQTTIPTHMALHEVRLFSGMTEAQISEIVRSVQGEHPDGENRCLHNFFTVRPDVRFGDALDTVQNYLTQARGVLAVISECPSVPPYVSSATWSAETMIQHALASLSVLEQTRRMTFTPATKGGDE